MMGPNMGMGGMMMPNMGMGGMNPNMGMGGMMMPNMGMGGMNPNMGMGGMMMPNMGMGGMMMPNMGMQQIDWTQGYNVGNPGANNSDLSQRKISCMFKTTTGQKPIIILMDYGKTINDLVKTYFARVGQPDLINKKEDVCLLYNATKIDFSSTQKIEAFFGTNTNPQILVNDTNNLIGA